MLFKYQMYALMHTAVILSAALNTVWAHSRLPEHNSKICLNMCFTGFLSMARD